MMKRIDQLDDEIAEAPGRCEYETHDSRCIASATRMIVVQSTVMIAGKMVNVELLSCDEHRDVMRGELSGAALTIDSEHAYEHRCGPVFAADRGEVTVWACDCGHVVGVE